MTAHPPSPPAAAGGGVRRGLSLMEVLVALAIFLFALVSLGRLIDIGGDRAKDIEYVGRASMIAQTKMAEVTAGALPLTSQGDTPVDEDPDWSWAVTAEAADAPGLYRVAITVSRQRPDGTRFERVLNQYVLDPTVRGNTDGSATGTDDAAATTTGTTTGGTP